MKYTIIPPSDFLDLPWKNGQGVTRELMIKQTKKDAPFDWRISRAVVDRDGFFSDFSGYDRILIMLEGKGMDLFCATGENHKFRSPYDLAQFSGDAGTRATLLNGPIQDFNIMVRKDRYSASVDLFKAQGRYDLEINATDFLIYAPEHDTFLNRPGKNEIHLPAGHLFHQTGEAKLCHSWQIQGKNMICIQIK
ncbi:HutD/Ves family protein [Desulfocicer vacuolatum]|nr:HutD family protein [Desulfocicer vacuolatum]